MKKRLTLLMALVLFVSMSIVSEAGIFGFLRRQETTSKDRDGKIVVGLSLPTQREERWVRDREQMQREAMRLGIDLRVQISDADVALQNAQIENLLAQGIDVLILAPHDSAAVASAVENAQREGVPVISYDRLIMNADVELYISFDNVGVGRLQGEYITKQVPKGNYVIMSGAATDNNATLFKQGAMEFIQPLIDKGDINVVSEQSVDDWLPSNALRIIEDALTRSRNNVDAILAPNDGTAGGAVVALEAQGMAGKVPVTGQDAEVAAVRRIVAGTQSMTIFKDTRALGTAAIEAAVKMAKNEEVETNGKVNNNYADIPSLLLIPQLVTKENIDVLFDSGYMKRDDVY